MIFSRMIQHNIKVLVAIIVYKNSQRSGLITNLTYKEYQMKKEPSTLLNVQIIRSGLTRSG